MLRSGAQTKVYVDKYMFEADPDAASRRSETAESHSSETVTSQPCKTGAGGVLRMQPPRGRRDKAAGVGQLAEATDHKLVPAWLVGQRTTEDGLAFMYDLKDRLPERIQLSTDGHQAYRGSVPYAFEADEVDWAQIHKIYKSQAVAPGRNSPPACTGTKVTVRLGDPTRAGSARAMWSARTSRCEWGCAGSRA